MENDPNFLHKLFLFTKVLLLTFYSMISKYKTFLYVIQARSADHKKRKYFNVLDMTSLENFYIEVASYI